MHPPPLPFTLPADSACLAEAVIKSANLGHTQRLILGDAFAGFLSYDKFDVNVMAGQKKCLSRFKTASGQTLWETMKKAMKDMRYFWPMKYMDAALHNKILANKDKECAPTGYQQCTEGCEKKEMYPSYMMGGTAEKPWRDAGPVFVAKSDLGPFSNYGSWFEWNPMSVKTLSGGKVRSRRQSWAERLRRGCVCRSACVHTCKSVRVRGVRGGWVSSRVLAKWDRLSGNLVGAVGNELAQPTQSFTHTRHSFTPLLYEPSPH